MLQTISQSNMPEPKPFRCDILRPKMPPVPPDQQQALVSRSDGSLRRRVLARDAPQVLHLRPAVGGRIRRQALFHAPTRTPVGFEEVIREYGKIGIGYWTTHDTDVIPTEALGKDGQHEIVAAHSKPRSAKTGCSARW